LKTLGAFSLITLIASSILVLSGCFAESKSFSLSNLLAKDIISGPLSIASL